MASMVSASFEHHFQDLPDPQSSVAAKGTRSSTLSSWPSPAFFAVPTRSLDPLSLP